VGEAKDGVEALKIVYSINPDIIVLDLMMPKMTGDAVAKAIMSTKPIPIILLTSLTDAEIKKSFNLLENTVVDIIKKPIELDENFIDNLKRKIKICANLKINKVGETLAQALTTPNIEHKSKYILTIGVSTGGPKTLKNIIPFLTSIKNLPLIVVQHIEPDFEAGYLNWIKDFSNKETVLINKKLRLDDRLFICSPKFNVEIESKGETAYLFPVETTPNQLFFPSIDNIVSNIAYKLKNRLIHIQLTGLGNDGQHASNLVKKLGGIVIAQKPEAAIASSMPRAVMDIADYVLDLTQINEKIMEILRV
jgi:two-component system chemotaxis response regulator CheB